MAECSITGETTLAGYYALFVDEDGGRHFLAMESPTNYKGAEIPTAGATIQQVADFIDDLGKAGTLRWNPREIRWNGVLLNFLKPVRFELSGSNTLDELMAGGSTRIARTVEIDGQSVANVEVDQLIPPLLFRGVFAEQQARASA